MPKTHVRVPGGGNTYVVIGLGNGKKVEFLSSIQDRPGSAPNPVPIQGIGDRYPVEIATGYSMGMGSLTLEVWETWDYDGWVSAFMTTDSNGNMTDESGIWDAFRAANVDNAHGNAINGYPVDLVEVLEAQRMNPEYITVQKIILGADGTPARIKNYHGCVISAIDNGETVRNDTMTHPLTITMNYTHSTVISA